MARLRKDQAEQLLSALGSATSGPLEEITMVRHQLTEALRIVFERSGDDWSELIDAAATAEGWAPDRARLLHQATAPQQVEDPDSLLWALRDLVTE